MSKNPFIFSLSLFNNGTHFALKGKKHFNGGKMKKTIILIFFIGLGAVCNADSYYDYKNGSEYLCTLSESNQSSDCYRDLTEKICQRYNTGSGECTYFNTTTKTYSCDSGCYEEEVCKRYNTGSGECTYFNTYVKCPN